MELRKIELKRIIFLIIIIFPLLLSKTLGGTTGKIAGKVTDKETGEPLAGVNIIIKGTMMGAASDAEGNYYIINIPPGIYSVKASLIGYASVTITNVKVSADQTTRIDFELTQKAIKMSDVIVSAKKPLVRKDLTSTESKVDANYIKMLPVEDVGSVINLQAGVVNGHFRGGRRNEVEYLVDGVSVNDQYSGDVALSPELNSIQEIQVITGTFNAEYGQAMSGIVNQITRLPGNKYEGDVSVYTGDYVSNRRGLYYNIGRISPKDVYNFQGFLTGPVPGLKDYVKFFLSGRSYYNDGYLYGRRMFNPHDSSNFSANDPADWYIGKTGDNKYVSMNFNKRYTLQGKLVFNVGKGRGIILSGMYQYRKYKDYNHLFKLNPDGDYTKYQKSFLGSLSYTYVINNSSFIDFLASIYDTKFSQYVFKNPYDPRYVNPDRLKDVSGNAFYTGGTENWHFYHDTKTYHAKVDLTWQINNIHQIKTGLEFQYYDLSSKNFQIMIDASTGYKPKLPKPGAFNYNIYTANPYKFSAYIQDKIELSYLIVNVGVRFDYFEPDGRYLKDPNKINILDNFKPPFPDSLMARATPKYQLSPRIGISYPITDKGAIHISYGHFFQIPPFKNLYLNPNFRIPLTGEFPQNIGSTIGNTNLAPQQTIMYEIGLQQQLSNDIGVTITGYYKDIRNLLSTEIHIKNNFRKFSKLINRDFGSVKGITISLTKQLRQGFGATIDYTFQIAKGTASDPEDAFNKAQANPPIEPNKQLVPLSWDRRHQLNFTLSVGDSNNYVLSAVGQLGSGLPYTPSLQNQRTGLENSENKPTYFDVDLYFTKYLKLFGKNMLLFVKIYNLFDTANEIDVFGDTGRAGYTLELTRRQERPRGVNTLKEFFTRPDFYSVPRQINIGFTLNF